MASNWYCKPNDWCPMTSFPQFASLPLELQREIWQASLDEAPEPGVHIFRSEDSGNGDPASITIDISCNTLMHACRESRSMARRQLKFHHVDRGACLGPYRAFDPELDAIYVSARDWEPFFCEESLASWSSPPASLRHLALDARVLGSGANLRMLASCLGVLSGLRTVSVVFSEEGWVPRDHVPSGDLPYQLVDCGPGDVVWHAPPGRVKRQDMDPWAITKTFHREIRHFLRVLAGAGITHWECVPYDSTTNEFSFDIIPRRIVPKQGAIGYGMEEESSLISSIVSGLRGLMPFYSR